MSLLKRKYIVTGGISKSLNFWTPQDGKFLYTIKRAQDGYIKCMCNYGSDIFATGSDDTIVLWKWKQKKIWKEIPGNGYTVNTLLSYPYNSRKPSYVISGYKNCLIRMWNIEDERCVGKFIGHTGEITKICCSFDGKLFSSSDDSTIRIWEIDREQVLYNLKRKEDTGTTHCLDFDQKANLIFSGTESNQINIWNEKSLVGQIKSRNSVHSICCLPNHQFVFGDEVGRLFLHDHRKLDERIWKMKPHRNVVSDIVNLRNGSLGTCSVDSSIRLFRLEDGKILRKMKERRDLQCMCVVESPKRKKCPFALNLIALPFKRDLTRYRITINTVNHELNGPRFFLSVLVDRLRNVKNFVHSLSNRKMLDDHCYYLVDSIYEKILNIRGKIFILKEGRTTAVYYGDWKRIERKKKPSTSLNRKSVNLTNNNNNPPNSPDNSPQRIRRVRKRSLSVGLPPETSAYAPLRPAKKKTDVLISGKGKIFLQTKKDMFTLVYDGEIKRNQKHGFGKTFKVLKESSKSERGSTNNMNPNIHLLAAEMGKIGMTSSLSSGSVMDSSISPMKKSSSLSRKRKKFLKKQKDLLNVSLRIKCMGHWKNDLFNGFGIYTTSTSKNVKFGIFSNGKFDEKIEEILSKAEKNNNELEKEFREFFKFKKMNKIFYVLNNIWETTLQRIVKSVPYFSEQTIKKGGVNKEEESEGEEAQQKTRVETGSDSGFNEQKRLPSIPDQVKDTYEETLKRILTFGNKTKELIQSFEKRMKLVNFGEYRYLGNWINDTFDGEGSLYIRNSSKKKRLSLTNLMKKKYTLVYYGEFRNGKKSGVGRLYETDGKDISYFGKWENDLKHGQGIEYGRRSSDTKNTERVIIREGEWKSGKFVGSKVDEKVKEIDLRWFFKEILSDPIKSSNHFIGQGTFAQVFRIFVSKYGWCAFKYFPHAGRNEEQLKSIKSEMDLISSLNHENIIRIYACSMKEPVGIIQEFLDISMNDFIDKLYKKNKKKKTEEEKTEDEDGEKKILFRKKMKTILETSRGMEYLHHNHVIHRDLKWDNVMLDKHGTVRIIDFGFSKWIKSFLPQRNTYGKVGSPFYVAPEVLTGSTKGDYKYKCDVFSFGIMLYELIFETLDPYDIANRENYFGSIEWEVAKKGVRPIIPKDWNTMENSSSSKVESGGGDVGSSSSSSSSSGSPGSSYGEDGKSSENDMKWLLNLMKRCWDGDPDKRPTFTQILQEIHSNTYFL